MKKSMTIIAVMGAVGMVLLSMLILSFLGKVGGVGGFAALKKDLLVNHRLVIASEEDFEVRRIGLGEGAEKRVSMRIAFTPVESIARAPARLERYMRKMARQVFTKPRWAKVYDYVDVVAVREKDEIHRRYTKEDCEAVGVR